MNHVSIYATNVMHYQHVLHAMSASYSDIRLIAPWAPTKRTTQLASGYLVPLKLKRLLERRSTVELEPNVTTLSLGLGQFIPPLMARAPIRISHQRQARVVTQALARRVASRATEAHLFQFVEGLGHLALRKGRFDNTILERRNLHHEEFESEIDTYLGFPFAVQRDPIRDQLQEEYDRVDHIVVYSEVARESFLRRGFSAERVHVVPLALPQHSLPTITRPRDPFRLLYVGRCDAYKGIDVAVATARILGPRFRLTVAGPAGPAVRTWLETQDNVDYVGIAGKLELREHYSTAALLLAPSIESFGFAVCEALDNGLSALTRETTGVSDFLPPNLRHTVSGREPDEWAAAATAVLSQGLNGQPSSERETLQTRLDWTTSSQMQLKLYERFQRN